MFSTLTSLCGQPWSLKPQPSTLKSKLWILWEHLQALGGALYGVGVMIKGQGFRMRVQGRGAREEKLTTYGFRTEHRQLSLAGQLTNPGPWTLNPAPWTLNPEPWTLPEPWALNPALGRAGDHGGRDGGFWVCRRPKRLGAVQLAPRNRCAGPLSESYTDVHKSIYVYMYTCIYTYQWICIFLSIYIHI